MNIRGTLMGDADLDGNVDAEDFLVWNNNKFLETDAWCSGDFDGSGFVDGGDFFVWNANKFMSATPPAVPEPASLALLMVALLMTARLCRD